MPSHFFMEVNKWMKSGLEENTKEKSEVFL